MMMFPKLFKKSIVYVCELKEILQINYIFKSLSIINNIDSLTVAIVNVIENIK